MPEVIREYEISGKRIGKRLVKVQHFQEPVPFDGVQVTISERSDVGRRLAQCRVLPKRITEHVTFA